MHSNSVYKYARFEARLIQQFNSVLDRTTYPLPPNSASSASRTRSPPTRSSASYRPDFTRPYAESVYPVAFFIDGRQTNGQLDLNVARGFFETNTFPPNFFRSGVSSGLREIAVGIQEVFVPPPIAPGGNNGTVNSYTPNLNSADFSNFLQAFTQIL